MMLRNINAPKKIIIIGAGLGGLTHGILQKKARPQDEVIIYDLNAIPGGFCTAFEKAVTYKDEKIKYTINIPLVTSDFGKNEPFDYFLDYLGIKKPQWEIVEKLFQFYPLDKSSFLFDKNGLQNLIALAETPEDAKNTERFLKKMKMFYNDIFHKAQINPNLLQAVKMLLTIPASIMTFASRKTYLEILDDYNIKTSLIREIMSCAEAFMGLDVDKVSAVAEMLMLQTFLENNPMRPANGDTFQTLSNNMALRFQELGGKLYLKNYVECVTFDHKKATGVIVAGKEEKADQVILAVAQDMIAGLLSTGKHIAKVNGLLKKIKSIPYPNSDFYCYYLIDKKVIDENPRLTDIAYHVYRLPEGLDRCNWKMIVFVFNKLYNEKYYVMGIIMVEQDQKRIEEWIRLRENNYQEYIREKEKQAGLYIEQLQKVEPVFKKYPPLKTVLVSTPASYLPYGSKYPISGLAQNPDNFAMTRIKQAVLDNLFISAGASFSSGVWGAIAGGWLGFVESYRKLTGIKIGNNDVMYKPGLKNLP